MDECLTRKVRQDPITNRLLKELSRYQISLFIFCTIEKVVFFFKKPQTTLLLAVFTLVRISCSLLIKELDVLFSLSSAHFYCYMNGFEENQ